jgi:DNA (cytosine-5)-methyltransferase 1
VRYLSVCSGIEAASKAWEPIGWEPVAFSEIEPFPAAVLKHHWPKVQNLGDMTKYEQWPIQSGTIDLLVGGTPCQSFSVAGLRQGLKDPRGNLMLTYLGIAERFKPRWLVWENVPGVLSSNGGKDFGSFLGALGELGYEWAYRVLDAQWFGVAQRRRRVFVIAHLGKGNFAAKVLFESESVRRDTPPRREARQGVATDVEAGAGVSPTITQCKGSRGGCSDEALMEIKAVHEALNQSHWNNPSAPSDTLLARDYKGIGNQDLTSGRLLVPAIPIHDQATRHSGKHGDKQDGKGNGLGVGKPGDPCPTLTKGDKHAIAFSFDSLSSNSMKSKNPISGCNQVDLARSLDTSRGLDPTCNQGGMAVLYENHPNDSRVTGPHDVAPSCVSRYGTGGGNVPLVQEAVAFPATMSGTQCAKTKNLSPAICSVNQTAVAVDAYNHALQEKAVPIRSTASDICHTGGVINPADRMAVRRLTPRECERLQGFPDDHTLIPWRNKPADQCPDGPRYKALGNSMAVPCMAWIGERIEWIENERQGAA